MSCGAPSTALHQWVLGAPLPAAPSHAAVLLFRVSWGKMKEVVVQPGEKHLKGNRTMVFTEDRFMEG